MDECGDSDGEQQKSSHAISVWKRKTVSCRHSDVHHVVCLFLVLRRRSISSSSSSSTALEVSGDIQKLSHPRNWWISCVTMSLVCVAGYRRCIGNQLIALLRWRPVFFACRFWQHSSILRTTGKDLRRERLQNGRRADEIRLLFRLAAFHGPYFIPQWDAQMKGTCDQFQRVQSGRHSRFTVTSLPHLRRQWRHLEIQHMAGRCYCRLSITTYASVVGHQRLGSLLRATSHVKYVPSFYLRRSEDCLRQPYRRPWPVFSSYWVRPRLEAGALTSVSFAPQTYLVQGTRRPSGTSTCEKIINRKIENYIAIVGVWGLLSDFTALIPCQLTEI